MRCSQQPWFKFAAVRISRCVILLSELKICAPNVDVHKEHSSCYELSRK